MVIKSSIVQCTCMSAISTKQPTLQKAKVTSSKLDHDISVFERRINCVHKDTARYVLSNSKPLELLYQVNVDFFQSQIIKQYVYRFFLLIYTKV